MTTEAFTETASAYLLTTGMSDVMAARIVADLSAMARQHLPAAQAPLELSGWHLLDALDCIAPERTSAQLDTKVCIHGAPASTETPLSIADEAFCWLASHPAEGSIRLDGSTRIHEAIPAPGGVDVVAVATHLIEAARWVNSNSCARRQPDARALARSVLQLTRPIIDAHVRHGRAPTFGGAR